MIAVFAVALPALAQVAPGLVDPTLFGQFSSLEQNSAQANQAVYELLKLNAGCTDVQPGPNGACSGQAFDVFDEVRELAQTANELNGSGPTNFSLGLDSENLGFALRWTSGEEVAAISTALRDFTSSQTASLASRLSSLRSVGHQRVAGRIDWQSDRLYASTDTPPSAEESIVEPWSGYVDSSFGFGNQDDTTGFGTGGGFKDAFDYDNREITLGSDYRVNSQFTVGLLFGYTDKSIDFNSSESIVDGTVDSDGLSLIAYTLFESGSWYATASLGAQWLSFDLTRRITYPSFNPLIPSTDETAQSNTDTRVFEVTLGGGYDWQFDALTIGSFLRTEYLDSSIDGFTESAAEGFDLQYDDDSFSSLDSAAGFRLTYVVTPPFGVLIPFLQAEYRIESEVNSGRVKARYIGVDDIALVVGGSSSFFVIPTDPSDGNFGVLSAGLSVVLPGGLQGFMQYQQTVALDDLSQNVLTGGIRYEF